MSASPDSGKLPGFCHIRRQSNRSAQKQIICPIYRGKPSTLPYGMGHGTKILDSNAWGFALQGMSKCSFLERFENRHFVQQLQSLVQADSNRFRVPAAG